MMYIRRLWIWKYPDRTLDSKGWRIGVCNSETFGWRDFRLRLVAMAVIVHNWAYSGTTQKAPLDPTATNAIILQFVRYDHRSSCSQFS